MAVTLQWLVSNEKLNNFKCVAGEKHMNDVITSVNILDNPDVVKWIKRDEFVLTTGYILKDDVELQKSIIRELKETGCAGLGFKIKRFFNSVPQEMIDEANRVGLPLIEMPFYYSFSEISKLIYDEINEQKMSKTELKNRFINKLSEAFFENMGLDYMMNELAVFIKKPVLLVDGENTLLSVATSPKYADFFPQNELPILEPLNVSPVSYINMDKTSSDIYKYFSINGGKFRFFVLALPDLMGSLCVLIEGDQIDSFYHTVLEHATHILSLELAKNKTAKVSPHSYHDFFLDFLMSSDEKTDEEIVDLCSFYGFDYKPKRVCITFVLSNCDNDYHKKQVINLICQSIKDELSEKKATYLCTGRDILSLFIFYDSNFNAISAVHDAWETANNLYESIKNNLSCRLKIGISRCHAKIGSIGTAFKDSIGAVSIEMISGENNPVFSFTNQLSNHLIKKLTKEEIVKLYEDTVEPLIRFDSRNGTELFLTFQTYFFCKFNASETAKKMFLHRNTLMNRLDKIKEILSTDFSCYGEVYSLYLGICAYDLLESST